MKCKIDCCERDVMYKRKKLCQVHYFRFMRYGTYDLTASRKKIRTHSSGYICIHEPCHPLANSIGEVYEHRKVIYSIYGDNIPDCELCGKKTDWKPYATHIDHINRIKSDNRPDNLRVLCNGCNSTRDIEYVKRDYVTSVIINGEEKTAWEWAKHKDANHGGASILNRIKKGIGHYDAVFGKNKTHPKNKTI